MIRSSELISTFPLAPLPRNFITKSELTSSLVSAQALGTGIQGALLPPEVRRRAQRHRVQEIVSFLFLVSSPRSLLGAPLRLRFVSAQFNRKPLLTLVSFPPLPFSPSLFPIYSPAPSRPSLAHRSVVKSYVEGLCWVLEYYFQGTPSWQWYYPHHFSPFASDFTDLASLDIDFTLGKPFRPYEQLMGVFPAAR